MKLREKISASRYSHVFSSFITGMRLPVHVARKKRKCERTMLGFNHTLVFNGQNEIDDQIRAILVKNSG